MNKNQHIKFAKSKHRKQLKRNAKKRRTRIHGLYLAQLEKFKDREDKSESDESDFINFD
tara:strand:+ start:517 stop:693 length:177 start_codon:yes stop_codon:yes gene_type:complete